MRAAMLVGVARPSDQGPRACAGSQLGLDDDDEGWLA